MTKPYAVIMAGGSGTRFWPASRRARPKQLLALGGDEVLLREAVNRIEPLCGADHIYIATGRHLVEPTLAALPELTPSQLLVEPAARNTAPCIGWAAATVARRDPEAVVMALPADPHIADVKAFRATVKLAIDAAREGQVVTIGVTPTHPETGYGYIEAKDGGGAVREVKRFVEKPDAARAEAFLKDGHFYWNAGMFFFRAKDMIDAISKHMPDLAAGLSELDRAAAAGREDEALATVFPKLPSVSIDHGVMEHLSGMVMVPGDFGWSDVGSWLAASQLASKDAHGNSAPAHAVLVGAEGNHVVDARSDAATGAKRVIALVGVRDLVVVETDDALLVLDREQAQRVREVVGALKDRGDGDFT